MFETKQLNVRVLTKTICNFPKVSPVYPTYNPGPERWGQHETIKSPRDKRDKGDVMKPKKKGTRTFFLVIFRTSLTYLIWPSCLMVPTAMDSAQTSEAMYFSTLMPSSLSTKYPVKDQREM